MKKANLKKVLLFISVISICIPMLFACGGNGVEKGFSEDIPVNSEETPENVQEEVKEPEVLYTGVVCQLPSNGTSPFTALRTDGSYDKLGERGVYGYPEVTADGKYVFYRQTQADPETREYTERLFVMQPKKSAFELANNAKKFILSSDESCIVTVCDDGVYFTNDFSKRCEKVFDTTEVIDSYAISETNSKIAILDRETNLYLIDVATKSATLIDTGVTFMLKRVCDNTIYYAKDSGLYLWTNGASSFVSDWWLSTDFKQIFATGTDRYNRQYHYLNADGTVYDIDSNVDISSFSMMSPNGKYFVTGSGNTIYRYEITNTGFVNETALTGNGITIHNVNNDGIVVACSAEDDSFGIFENNQYKKLSDGVLLAYKMGYSPCVHFGNGCVYFSYEDTLYKYTFGGETETIKENIYSFVANGDFCYYTNNYDKSKERGDLWGVGFENMVDDYVQYIYVR